MKKIIKSVTNLYLKVSKSFLIKEVSLKKRKLIYKN